MNEFSVLETALCCNTITAVTPFWWVITCNFSPCLIQMEDYIFVTFIKCSGKTYTVIPSS